MSAVEPPAEEEDSLADDNLITALAGEMTWPKVVAIAVVGATLVAICAICGYAPGWDA